MYLKNRKFGRYIGKDGFVDADQSIHRANVKQKNMEKYKAYSDDGKSSSTKKKQQQIKIRLTSTDIAGNETDREKLNDRHMKAIEDQMIQSKQEERAFKRQEGDVKKEQRQIRQTVREFDNCNFIIIKLKAVLFFE